MSTLVNEKLEECCGCTACYSICPKQAITMRECDKGFKYPVIDEDKCVNCNLCQKVCAFSKEKQQSYGEQPIAAYAIKHLDEKVRSSSRSGGVFTAITDYILDQGGCVFGAVMNEKFEVFHAKAESHEQRDAMRKSKYVQSDMGDIYQEVKQELSTGRLVAFSGTACQVAGLKSYLGKEYDNLYTFDLVCHGVPSPKVWKDYITLMQKKYHNKVKQAEFRDKSFLGWDMHIESFLVGKRKKYSRNYSMLFNKNHILRDSCFNCKYTNMARPGDFTLADFWGVNDFVKDYDDNKGVSLLFVNSPKAENLFKQENIQNRIDFHKCSNYEFRHPNLKHPEVMPDDRDEFWKEYEQNGLSFILKKYSMGNIKKTLQARKSFTIIYIKRKLKVKKK